MSEPNESMEVESGRITQDPIRFAPSSEPSSQLMDTGETGKNVMATGATGSVTCSLHPLVIMNVSEHWTRTRAQAEGPVPQGVVFIM